MNYKKFTVTDFLADENFQNWIVEPDAEKDKFWNKWLDRHPEKRVTVERAREVLLNIGFKEDFPSAEKVRKSLEENLLQISMHGEVETGGARVVKMNSYKKLRWIAAIFLGLLLVAGGTYYFNWQNAEVAIATNYGEMKTIDLPDGSSVILNAHSSIRYLKHWRNDRPRKVNLQGEAFFKVNHLNKNPGKIKESERFIVTTADLNVEVLGTTFDVKSRHGQTDVILESGKVRVAFNQGKQKDVTMIPGEMITYSSSTHALYRTVTEPAVETAWIDKKLILDNITVNKIIRYLEDNYGYRVELSDTAIGSKKMEGTLMLDNLQDILFVLSTSLDIKIEKKDSTLLFSEKPDAH